MSLNELRAAGNMLARCLIVLAAIAAAPVHKIDAPPHSIGPHKNILELLALPPKQTFASDGSPELEACLVVALSYGLGGAPVVTHEPEKTMIASLLPRTFGVVSSMIVLLPGGVVEYRGDQEFEFRLVKQCLGA